MLLLKLLGIWLVFTIVGTAILTLAPQVAAPLVCRADEHIETRTTTTSDARGTAYASDVYCVNEAGTAREVSALIFMPFMGISIVGLLLAIVPGVVNTRRKRWLVAQAFRDTPTSRPAASPPRAPDRSASPDGLNSKLHELKQSYEQGLLTESEYQQAKQALLDNFTG